MNLLAILSCKIGLKAVYQFESVILELYSSTKYLFSFNSNILHPLPAPQARSRSVG